MRVSLREEREREGVRGREREREEAKSLFKHEEESRVERRRRRELRLAKRPRLPACSTAAPAPAPDLLGKSITSFCNQRTFTKLHFRPFNLGGRVSGAAVRVRPRWKGKQTDRACQCISSKFHYRPTDRPTATGRPMSEQPRPTAQGAKEKQFIIMWIKR